MADHPAWLYRAGAGVQTLLSKTPLQREVFADPLFDRASAVILAHNHPDGSLKPSEQDIETTQRLRQAGEIMGITVLDHIIFNGTEYFSFLENDIGF